MTTADAIDQRIHNCHFTHAGNAEALALLHGDKMRYVHEVGWYIWNGSHWQPDTDEQAKQLAKGLALYRQKLVSRYEQDPKEKLEKIRHALRMENRPTIEGWLYWAYSTSPFLCLPGDMDSDPTVLACHNGTVYLQYGWQDASDPDKMITMCTDIPYDQTAKAPRWQQFLEEVFIHPDGTADYDLIQYMKKALGYSITGDTRERCLFY